MAESAGPRVRRVDFACAEDVSSYLELLDAYARDPMGGGAALPREVRKRLPRDLAERPGTFCLLVEITGQVAGMATCFLGYSTFRARPLLNIHDIAVRNESRGRGAARALLDAITDLALQLGCCRITLEVREDNGRARAIYRQAGFVPGGCGLFMEKALLE